MHVLILALRIWIIKTKFAYLFFWLIGFFIVLIEWFWEKKERGRTPSCPPIFRLLIKATRTLNFLRIFLLVKNIRNLQISLRNELLYSHDFITY